MLKGVKNRELCMREYLAKIQLICNSLESYGYPVLEVVHISIILTGLPNEYESICGKIDHLALRYYHQFDQSYSDDSCPMFPTMSSAFVNFSGFSNEAATLSPPSGQAYNIVASLAIIVDETWYPDTGGTNHLVNNEAMLA
ncbi:hypothetical protein PVK06_002367 [Gossypium arboreum]|uniref:Uncharacterized protein n=1 Tax=Gossypium arboreum TaxID=29729 RepID=A0ABR0R4H6_GOSAR|nr:hypothetical protein PVK06_002367 [Gossypium arboreum]